MASMPLPHPEDAALPTSSPTICLTRAQIVDRRCFFYAFGNTPPEYVLPGVRLDAASADVLLLASGDLRSAMYSLARDTSLSATVRFTVNDGDVRVVARNVVLLWLMHNATASDVFAVWFSLGLTPAADDALRRAVAALTGADAGVHLAAIGARFRCDDDRAQVTAILQGWVAKHSWVEAQEARTEFLATYRKCTAAEIPSSFENTARLDIIALATTVGHSTADVEVMADETKEYARNGVLLPLDGGVASIVNPTLMTSERRYDVHYGAVPFFAFPVHVSMGKVRLSLSKVTVASQVEQQKTSHTPGPLRDLCNDILKFETSMLLNCKLTHVVDHRSVFTIIAARGVAHSRLTAWMSSGPGSRP